MYSYYPCSCIISIAYVLQNGFLVVGMLVTD